MSAHYLAELKHLRSIGGSNDDDRRWREGIRATTPGMGIMQFCRNYGIAATKNAKFNAADVLLFMIWNTSSLECYQNSKELREYDENGYPLLRHGETFFCKDPLLFEVPQTIAMFDFTDTEITYYKNDTTLPDGWLWDDDEDGDNDEGAAFAEYDNVGRRLEFLYKTRPEYDDFAIGKYRYGNNVFYRIMKHKPNMVALERDLKVKNKLEAPPIQKPRTPKQEAFKKAKKTVNKPAATRKNIPQATPPPQTAKKQVVREVSRTMPDAFGYSIDISTSATLGPVFSFTLHGGTNYVVYTRGPYRWIPFRYAYYGYQSSINTMSSDLSPAKKKAQEDMMKSAIKPFAKKVSNLSRKIAGELSIGFSPFVAWKEASDENIEPASWNGWFVANTFSLKMKVGAGFSIGRTVFEGRTLTGVPADVEEDIFDARVQKVLFEEDAKPDDWYGVSLDIGIGFGTPGLIWSDTFPSYYILRDNKVFWSNITKFNLLKRWAEFLSARYIGDDLLYLIQRNAPKIISWVLQKISSL